MIDAEIKIIFSHAGQENNVRGIKIITNGKRYEDRSNEKAKVIRTTLHLFLLAFDHFKTMVLLSYGQSHLMIA